MEGRRSGMYLERLNNKTMMESKQVEQEYIRLSGNKAKGRRPFFFHDPSVEKVLNITMALAGEVAVMRERMDTIERLLDAGQLISRDAIEKFVPDEKQAEERQEIHAEFIARILRIVQQELEAIADPTLDQPVEEIANDMENM